MTYAQPAQPAQTVEPGKNLGIAALISVFFIALLGLILGIVARGQSRAAGLPNTPAKIAVILGIIFLALQVIGGILGFVFLAPYVLGIETGVNIW